MAPFAGKRKRVEISEHPHKPKKTSNKSNGTSKTRKAESVVVEANPDAEITSIQTGNLVRDKTDNSHSSINVQIVTGSYERVLHGLSAAIPQQLLDDPQDADSKTTFSENFLFAAHTSSIRCLAISPPTENDKRLLATGGSDERINVYSISTVPPRQDASHHAPTLNGSRIAESSGNRSLGSLVHHDRAITRLQFPVKSKMFSAAEDNTVTISRTRDWTVLSSIKAPIPKPFGRPSGDTAAPGEVPAGVNDFAIHPSQKLMLSVSRGEKCLRLWNLMTGKKAGVLNFERDLLAQAGEGKYSSGEGRRILWDDLGERYVVVFERGAIVYGIDSKPQAIIKPSPPTKLHQVRSFSIKGKTELSTLLAISTEDGRVLFFSLGTTSPISDPNPTLPKAACVAQIGGKATQVNTRIKDFEVVQLPSDGADHARFLVITAGSDGMIRLWTFLANNLNAVEDAAEDSSKQIGRLIAAHETSSRITCLGAFIMDGKRQPDAAHDEHSDLNGDDASSDSDE